MLNHFETGLVQIYTIRYFKCVVNSLMPFQHESKLNPFIKIQFSTTEDKIHNGE